jgi:hypothetical protein
MQFEEFDQRLTRLLQPLPAGTIAELTDSWVAWRDGAHTIYARVGADGHPVESPASELAGEWAQWRDWLAAWIDEPRFSTR